MVLANGGGGGKRSEASTHLDLGQKHLFRERHGAALDRGQQRSPGQHHRLTPYGRGSQIAMLSAPGAPRSTIV